MKCLKCNKPIAIDPIVYRNLEIYNVGGSKLAVSKCCGAGFIVCMKVSYQIAEYTGELKEDDWGNEIKQ